MPQPVSARFGLPPALVWLLDSSQEAGSGKPKRNINKEPTGSCESLQACGGQTGESG
jgi:hypothetical protein